MFRYKPFRMSVCAALCTLGVGTASAALLERGPLMVYDDVLDVTWLRDFNYAMSSGYDGNGLMSWEAANTWANALTVGGYQDWRLPTFDPTNARPPILTLTNEIGSLWMQLRSGSFIGTETDISPFYNLPLQAVPYVPGSDWYWTGVVGSYEGDNTRAWRFSMNCGCWDAPLQSAEFYATAVRSGDVAPIPEPETYAMLLAGLGLLGFWGQRRKREVAAA